MKRALKPLVTLLALAAVGTLLIWAFIKGRAEFAQEQERERPVQTRSRVTMMGTQSIVTLNPEEFARAGIVVAPIETTARSNVHPPRANSLPASAVVWWQGQSWVYVQPSPGRFTRRAVIVRATNANDLTVTGLAAGEAIVVRGAQLLLSEEQRSQIHVGEERG